MTQQVDSPMDYTKTRCELASPYTDWENTWRRARVKGLVSEATSFFWKLLHLLLPTEERLSRILPNSTDFCKLCPGPDQLHVPAPRWLVTGCFHSLDSKTPLQLLPNANGMDYSPNSPLLVGGMCGWENCKPNHHKSKT